LYASAIPSHPASGQPARSPFANSTIETNPALNPVPVDGFYRYMDDLGLKYGRARYGMTSGLILCLLRHLDEAAGLQTLKNAEPFFNKIIGVGLDSSEMGHPPSKFARCFARRSTSNIPTPKTRCRAASWA